MPLSEKSNKQYDNVYSIIQRKFDGAVNFEDTEKVMNALMFKENGGLVSDNTLKNRLTAVIHKSSNKVYKDKMVEVALRLKAKADTPETNMSKEDDFKYEDLKNAFDKAEGFDKMVLALYFKIPPRRLTDYIEMVVRMKPMKRYAKDKNYLVVDGDARYFVFNNYKTAKVYGKQIIAIPDGVWELFKDQVKDKQLLLLNPSSGKKFTDAQFSDYLRRLTMKLIGKKASASMFRHVFISHFLEKNPTTIERKRMAELMAHSVEMQLNYDRREE